MSEEYQKLSPAAKTILIWLLAKREIIMRKSVTGIRDEETNSFPWVISNDIEMAFYTNIDVTNIRRTAAQLQETGLVDIKIEKQGRIITKRYYLKEWFVDSLGYFPLSLKTMVTPAWISLGHNSKQLYLIFLSENAFAQGRTGLRFPATRMSYSTMSKMYHLSTRTIANALKELEVHGFVHIDHGELIKDMNKKRDNKYMLSIEFLWEDEDLAFGLKETLAYKRKENSERYKKGGNRISKEESDEMWEEARLLIAEHLKEKRLKALGADDESAETKQCLEEPFEDDFWDEDFEECPF